MIILTLPRIKPGSSYYHDKQEDGKTGFDRTDVHIGYSAAETRSNL